MSFDRNRGHGAALLAVAFVLFGILPAFSGERGGLGLRPLGPEELAWARGLFPQPGKDGGQGGDVTELILYQDLYSDPTDDDEILVLWYENVSNGPDGVALYIDGRLLGTMNGVDPAPDTNGVRIYGFTPGRYRIKVEGGGTSMEAAQTVLAIQPFSDPSSLACKSGGRDPSTGLCDLVFTWTIAGIEPDSSSVYINDLYMGEVPGNWRQAYMSGVPEGNYKVELWGSYSTANGNYLGSVVSTTCDIACPDQACNPPIRVFPRQVAYGSGNENEVLVEWTNGMVPYSGGIKTYLDGAAVGQETGDSTLSFLFGISTGQHTVGIQGSCGPAGDSTVTEEPFLFLSETPYKNPVTGDVTCQFDPGTNETKATWTNADPAEFIDVYVDDGSGTLFYLGSIAGDSTEVTVTGTTATDGIMLQFITVVAGFYYGSEIVGCSTLPPDPPQNLTATPGDKLVNLKWDAPAAGPAVTGYTIVRDGTDIAGVGPAETTYSDTGLTNGTKYCYKVVSMKDAQRSTDSNEACATPGVPPDPPQNLTATPGDTKVDLKWDAPAAGPAVTGYTVMRDGVDIGPIPTVGAGVTTYTDTGLTNGQKYCYKVVSMKDTQRSTESNEACATPVPPGAIFIRGDANGDKTVDLSDPVTVLGFLFLGNPASLVCHDAADADDSGELDLTDAVYSLNWQFLAGKDIPLPGPFTCGPDPTDDLLPACGFTAANCP